MHSKAGCAARFHERMIQAEPLLTSRVAILGLSLRGMIWLRGPTYCKE